LDLKVAEYERDLQGPVNVSGRRAVAVHFDPRFERLAMAFFLISATMLQHLTEI